MTTYAQANRAISVATPLGKDKLLLVGFTGREEISRLFSFRLEMLAENKTEIAFDKLLGQKVTVTLLLAGDKKRFFSGFCSRVSQGARDFTFTRYEAEVVPQFWFLTRRAQSRIFQNQGVPDILKKVLEGLDVDFETQGTFQPRDYCVQYRESDFDFASRLMEEEGIYYFFKHTEKGHRMVVANTPQSNPDLPEPKKLIYDEEGGGERDEERVFGWEKTQELRSGKYTLWDFCFEMPHKHLEAEQPIQESAAAGEVTHKLKVGGNDKLEIYDYPGAYAQRFDGVDRGGGDRSGDLQHIFEDNERTVKIRMEQEAVPGLTARGKGNCRHLVSGHKFSLERHFNADGEYVLTSVEHTATVTSSDYRTGEGEFSYENRFTCLPAAVPFRPLRLTPRPVVRGTQTAIVVGPEGEEIFTDKYGRVKVQFPWDREGKYDADSSCWVRVGTLWAGKQWGVVHIPRIGQEVIVDFLEGDPDHPIIVGSVYNAETMPPYPLPDNKTVSGVKSDTSPGSHGFNEIRFEDKKGKEQIFVHGERDMDLRVKNDRRELILHDNSLIVGSEKDGKKTGDNREEVKRDKHLTVGQDFDENVKRDHSLKVTGKESIDIGQSLSLKVGQGINEQCAMHSEEVTNQYSLKAKMIVLEAAIGLTIKAGASFITIGPAGIQIMGTPLTLINSGGAPLPAIPPMLVPPSDAALPDVADDAKPGSNVTYQGQGRSAAPASSPEPEKTPGEEKKKKPSWIAVKLEDESGKPVPGEPFEVRRGDEAVASGTTDEKGEAKVALEEPGSYKICFTRLDKEAWEEA